MINNMAKPVSGSTQKHIPVSEIHDDIIVMKDGGLRAVLLVSSINFALKGQDEQDALIAGYVSFVNTLSFPLQIVIQSRPLNLDEYLAELKRVEQQQSNQLLRVQIADYHDFLKELLELGDIMTKRFYVVVPYSASAEEKKSFWQRLLQLFSAARAITLSKTKFAQQRDELLRRIELVTSGLSSLGLTIVQLDTQSLIELIYNSYNPQIIDSQKLSDVGKLRLEEESDYGN
jgi:hypothetical protein